MLANDELRVLNNKNLYIQELYNGHLQGPVTLTPIAEHLAVELSLPIFTTLV